LAVSMVGRLAVVVWLCASCLQTGEAFSGHSGLRARDSALTMLSVARDHVLVGLSSTSQTSTSSDEYLTEERRDSLMEAFTAFDEDGDGLVSATEIRNAMRALGQSFADDELVSLVRQFDGDLNFDDFCELADERRTAYGHADDMVREAINLAFPKAKRVAQPEPVDPEASVMDGLDAFFDLFDDISDAFEVFDIDSGGTITLDEMAAVMRSLGQNVSEDELKVMLDGYDVNNNGAIDFDEFCMMISDTIDLPDSQAENALDRVRNAARQALSERSKAGGLQRRGK